MTADLSADFAKVRASMKWWPPILFEMGIDGIVDHIEATLAEAKAEVKLHREVASALRQQLREREDDVKHNPLVETMK